jgi:hypothetical protein
VGLLRVPWTTAGTAQAAHDLYKAVETFLFTVQKHASIKEMNKEVGFSQA